MGPLIPVSPVFTPPLSHTHIHAFVRSIHKLGRPRIVVVVLDNHGVSGFGARDPRDTDVLDVARHVGGRHARDGRVGPWQTKRGLRLVDVVDCDPLEGCVALCHGAGEYGGEGERECEEGEMHGEGGVICGVVVVGELGVYIAITPPSVRRRTQGSGDDCSVWRKTAELWGRFRIVGSEKPWKWVR